MTQSMTPLDPPAVAELQSLPANVLAGLPLATCVAVRLPAHDRLVKLYVAGGPDSDTDLAFRADEVLAMARGIEGGRAGANDVAAWSLLKASDPSFRVTADLALAGVAAGGDGGWSLGEVLREINAVVVGAMIADDTWVALPRAA